MQHGRAARMPLMVRAPRQGIEIGSGFSGARMLGSEHNDEFFMSPDGEVRTRTNRCGPQPAELAHACWRCRSKRCVAKAISALICSGCLRCFALAICQSISLGHGVAP